MPISLMLSGNGNYDSKRVAELSENAEKAGFDCLWFGETTTRDASVLAAIAAISTKELKLGTSIVNVFTRSPGQLAMMGGTINELSAGRFTLGLGTSSSPIVQGWHGIRYDRPVQTLEEVVRLVRSYFSGSRFSYEGRFFAPSNARFRVGPPPKIALAALGDRMIERASRLADQVILNLYPVERIRAAKKIVSETSAGSEKENPSKLSVMLYFVLDENAKTSKDAAKELLNFYMHSSSYCNLFRSCGFTSEVNSATEAIKKGEASTAKDSISDLMIEKLVVIGDMKNLLNRASSYLENGADEVLLCPSPFGNYAEYISYVIANLHPPLQEMR